MLLEVNTLNKELQHHTCMSFIIFSVKDGDWDNVTEVVTGGSLEMREMLSKQLENVMAESK